LNKNLEGEENAGFYPGSLTSKVAGPGGETGPVLEGSYGGERGKILDRT